MTVRIMGLYRGGGLVVMAWSSVRDAAGLAGRRATNVKRRIGGHGRCGWQCPVSGRRAALVLDVGSRRAVLRLEGRFARQRACIGKAQQVGDGGQGALWLVHGRRWRRPVISRILCSVRRRCEGRDQRHYMSWLIGAGRGESRRVCEAASRESGADAELVVYNDCR